METPQIWREPKGIHIFPTSCNKLKWKKYGREFLICSVISANSFGFAGTQGTGVPQEGPHLSIIGFL